MAITERSSDAEAFTIDEFCSAYRVGRTTLYELWRDNRGPPTARFGRKIVIPRRSAEEWLRSMVVPTRGPR
jgi:hypothetical protein